ncbi:MAG: hypothetical protein LBH13_08725 [Cellulomonadaceae bacterium]|nr:hypothetical protein [Cellulomonadaceae bacterium]
MPRLRRVNALPEDIRRRCRQPIIVVAGNAQLGSGTQMRPTANPPS